jgi:phospholipid/cholesterol/gamma-HCH transport system substrate-binding protein
VRRRRWAAAAVAALATVGLPACGGPATIQLTATFDDVGDLVRNHAVQVADVRVGRVTGIELTRDFRARVTMRIRADVKVPRASTAYLRTTSLLGEKFIELRPDDPAHPDRGPYLRDGDDLGRGRAAPEIEFVAEQAITVLGAVSAGDVATLVDTGAAGFGGRGSELRSLVSDLSAISATLADRSKEIAAIVDHLDRASATLAPDAEAVGSLFGRLAETARILAENRQRAVDALAQLGRLAAVQNEVLDRYVADVDRQVKQVSAILEVAAGQTAEVGSLVDWLATFTANLPRVVPEDFTQVYFWLVPEGSDPRSGGGGG